ncbi:hypothetical protein EWM64_g6821 [Hericium alpestre]|uniref:Uncharacterized protein n=1 Tax=Hericium alpestre TaxID=135208 RepID=A0A4Y9ZQZ3_9AGAM|nr:hypothetical protein EWM64_g6821 [Hericium alpestre]
MEKTVELKKAVKTVLRPLRSPLIPTTSHNHACQSNQDLSTSHDARTAKQLCKDKDKLQKHAERARNTKRKASQKALLRAQLEALPTFIIKHKGKITVRTCALIRSLSELSMPQGNTYPVISLVLESAGLRVIGAFDRHSLGQKAYTDAINQLGQAAFDALSPEEKGWALLFIWAGCGMHKELNAMKYGAEALKAWWDSDSAKALSAFPPIPLYNKDNAATAADLTASTSKIHAKTISSRGGIKAAELAGSIMWNQNSKKGQQDIYC